MHVGFTSLTAASLTFQELSHCPNQLSNFTLVSCTFNASSSRPHRSACQQVKNGEAQGLTSDSREPPKSAEGPTRG